MNWQTMRLTSMGTERVIVGDGRDEQDMLVRSVLYSYIVLRRRLFEMERFVREVCVFFVRGAMLLAREANSAPGYQERCYD